MFLELVRYASANNFDVIVASKGGELETDFKKAGARCVKIIMREGTRWDSGLSSSVRLSRLITAFVEISKSVASIVGVFQIVRLLLKRSTLVHASQPWPIFLSAIACKISSIPLIIHVHGTTNVEFPPPFSSFVQSITKIVIAITPEVARVAKKWAKGCCPVRILPNPVRACVPGTATTKWSSMCEVTRVATVASLTRNKEESLTHTMTAVAKLSERLGPIELVVSGDGPIRLRMEEYAEKLARNHHGFYARFLGAKRDPWQVLEDLDLVIGMGLVALEASFRGYPVVIVGTGGIGGVLTETNALSLYKTNYTGRGFGLPVPELISDAILEGITGGRRQKTPETIVRLHSPQYALPRFMKLWRDTLS